MTDQYNDEPDRTAVTKFFEGRDFDIKENSKTDGVDLFGMLNGRLYAIEIGHDNNWLKGEDEYTEPYLEIPERKWRHFFEAFDKDSSRILYDAGIYCYVSMDRQKAMLLDFKELLKIDITDSDNKIVKPKYGTNCAFIKVPISLVKRVENLV